MKTKLQPLSNYVIVKPDKEETMTEGGLYIPDTAQEKPKQGTVIAVGNRTSYYEGGGYSSYVARG